MLRTPPFFSPGHFLHLKTLQESKLALSYLNLKFESPRVMVDLTDYQIQYLGAKLWQLLPSNDRFITVLIKFDEFRNFLKSLFYTQRNIFIDIPI